MKTIPVVDVYEECLQKYDKKIKEIEEQESRKCKCCEGCEYCCHQIIIISDFEKEMLKQLINAMSFKERKELWLKARRTVSNLVALKLTPDTIRPDLSEQRQKEMQKNYFYIHEPCLFLNDEKKCSIYSHRPISCMTYKNYGDRDECMETPFVDGSITYNDVEWDMRKELFEKTNLQFDGFHILPFTVLDIMRSKRIFYELKKLPFLEYKPKR